MIFQIKIKIGDHLIGAREEIGLGGGIDGDDRVAHGLAQLRQSPGGGRDAEHHEARRWQDGLEIDLHATLALTGHGIIVHPGMCIATLSAGIHANESRRANAERVARLIEHDRPNAAAPNPSLDRSVLEDDRLRPRAHRLRRIARHNGRKHERLAIDTKLGDPLEDVSHS